MTTPMIRITTARHYHTAAIYRDLLDTSAWPGGYTIIYDQEGDELCAACASTYLPTPEAATYDEGPTLCCAECNAELVSSYGDPDLDTQPCWTGWNRLD